MTAWRLPRYRVGARLYDVLSAERCVYRAGRVAAIELLRLRPCDRVLVIGCGTGLDFPLVLKAIGSMGEVVGVDRSAAMLRQARQKAKRWGWSNVTLVNADATDLTGIEGTFDAVMFTYSLSIIDDWTTAWWAATGRLREGGKVSVVDTDLPHGLGRLLAAFALWTGDAHRRRRVWELVARHADESISRSLRNGHIHVSVGCFEKTPVVAKQGPRAW